MGYAGAKGGIGVSMRRSAEPARTLATYKIGTLTQGRMTRVYKGVFAMQDVRGYWVRDTDDSHNQTTPFSKEQAIDKAETLILLRRSKRRQG